MTTVILPGGKIPFDETYILYDKDDKIGLICCILGLTPMLLLQSYLTWFIMLRDFESVIFTVGQLSNELINQILKRIIKQERPLWDDAIPLIFKGMDTTGSSTQENISSLRVSYGMPSAHSQFMGFFTSYLILNMWFRWNYKYKIQPKDKIIYCVSGWLLSMSVCFSRWYLEYHNWDQIIIGYQIGIVVGALYYLFVVVIMYPVIKSTVSHSKFLSTWINYLRIRI